MIEALRIDLRDERDAGLIIGRILAHVNRERKARNVEILDDFFRYKSKTSTLRIFVD